ncbi:mfs transporter [Culex quinquefasciatus]|uniref:Mfs transporter n=1 Tax=Culex quinquefasciatus TaxID=7176 RepID=B0XGJ2_CULQU|nr:mfs transporter [Culex quinquefasciatus]|eukprot:XP_001868764.1 mfs transporter [Culex quinquefasciatus]
MQRSVFKKLLIQSTILSGARVERLAESCKRRKFVAGVGTLRIDALAPITSLRVWSDEKLISMPPQSNLHLRSRQSTTHSERPREHPTTYIIRLACVFPAVYPKCFCQTAPCVFLEYVGPKWRTFVANMSIALFFTTASCALPWIAYYLANWKLFAIVTSAPLALAIFTPLLVPESARWLVSQGKVDKAIKILKKFEKINKKTIDPKVYQDFSDSCVRLQEEEAANNNYSVLDLFKTPRLRNITILLILIWMAISLVFDGHVRNVGSLGLDLFFTFTVAAATELPADTFLTLTLDRYGRRWLACGTMVASGVFSLLATTVPVGAFSATLAILGRFSVNISYNIGLQYAAELLPTVVRAQGVAFIHIMGYVASIVAPFVVYLSHVSPSLPLIVLGILGIIGGLLSLMLPETLGHDLPQTLVDGEEFGRGQKIWDFPCLAKKINDDDDDRVDDLPVERFTRATSKTSVGASLRASTRGELRSSMLNRSIRSRISVRSLQQQRQDQMSACV